MTRTEANRILDQAKEGRIHPRFVRQALRVTGDMPPIVRHMWASRRREPNFGRTV